MNEDLMWERLKDIQREVQNSRLYGTPQRRWLHPGRWLTRLFKRRATVMPIMPIEMEDEPAVSDVA